MSAVGAARASGAGAATSRCRRLRRRLRPALVVAVVAARRGRRRDRRGRGQLRRRRRCPSTSCSRRSTPGTRPTSGARSRCTGAYLVDEQLLVAQPAARRRLRASRCSCPSLLDDGRVFVVDRGWVPVGSASIEAPDAVPAPPDGEVDRGGAAQGRRADPARDGPRPRASSPPSICRASPSSSARRPTPARTACSRSEDPAAADTPAAAVKPEADEGPHLSYALQWIAFGILAFVGAVLGVPARAPHRRPARRGAGGRTRRRARRPRRTPTTRTRPLDADALSALGARDQASEIRSA